MQVPLLLLQTASSTEGTVRLERATAFDVPTQSALSHFGYKLATPEASLSSSVVPSVAALFLRRLATLGGIEQISVLSVEARDAAAAEQEQPSWCGAKLSTISLCFLPLSALLEALCLSHLSRPARRASLNRGG